MTNEVYADKLRMQIGNAGCTAIASNYFPVVGDTVTIKAETKWAQETEWQIQDGSGDTAATPGSLNRQRDSKDIVIISNGELKQKVTARNYLTSASITKTLYAIAPQLLPYFGVTATEVVRVGSTGYINIIAENGYATSRSNTIVVRIYKENESEPIKSIDLDTNRPGPTMWASSAFSFEANADRGIYDVEVDVTDILTGITLTKRINKLITVVPALCPKPADTGLGYEVIGTYRGNTSYSGFKNFEMRLWRNVSGSGLNYAEFILPYGSPSSTEFYNTAISALPEGTTLCIKKDPLEPFAYAMRARFVGNKPSTSTNENGTANFSFEKPLIITHDCEDVLQWYWQSYGAVNFANNARNIVIDGYGYHNTGILFRPISEEVFYNSCMFWSDGSSDIEMFGVDIDKTGFAGISAKTDPTADQPWYWRGNGYEFKNMKIHHCTFQNSDGEGVYLGYYSGARMTSKSTTGEDVSYYAHLIRGLRLYRCNFYRSGFDSIQINNAVDVEICYCEISEAGTHRTGQQGYGFSCTFDGRIYNCNIHDGYGVALLANPLMNGLYIYNNIIISAKYNTVIQHAIWKSDNNEFVDPDGDGAINLAFEVYNNVLKGHTIGAISMDYSTAPKYDMSDNLIITATGLKVLPDKFSGRGNVFLTGDANYSEMDTLLKVADTSVHNYQPACDSHLVTSGMTTKAAYDMRGYKVWYDRIRHCGPLMGVYRKDAGENVLALHSVLLSDNGSRIISVELVYDGVPATYRIGETPDLSAVGWLPFPDGGIIEYTLSEGFGLKTVYVQIADANMESEVKSSAITYESDIVFKDSRIKPILLYRNPGFDSDANGEISMVEAKQAVTMASSWFSNNTAITSFDELQYFTGATINGSAFDGCTALTSVTFPNTMTSMAVYTLRGCTSLTDIVLSSKLVSIASRCFYGCTALKRITLPESLESVDADAFSNSGIEKLVFPASSKVIRKCSDCPNLTVIEILGQNLQTIECGTNLPSLAAMVIHATTPPAMGYFAFPASGCYIYVPDVAVDAYKTGTFASKAGYIKPLSEYMSNV